MEGVATVPAAVLLHLDALAVIRPVLHRDVVPSLADLAREGHLHTLVAGHWIPLLDDLGDAAGADGAATLADGEPQALFHRDGGDELDGHLGVVAGHDHLDSLGEADAAGDVGRPKVEL